MKKLLIIAVLGIALAACGSKGNNKAELTPEQEIQTVDSATQETKTKIDEIGSSVEDIQNEVDSLVNN